MVVRVRQGGAGDDGGVQVAIGVMGDDACDCRCARARRWATMGGDDDGDGVRCMVRVVGGGGDAAGVRRARWGDGVRQVIGDDGDDGRAMGDDAGDGGCGRAMGGRTMR